MSLSGDYKIASALEDVALMTETFSDIKSTRGLGSGLNSLKKTSSWLLSVAKFVNSLNGTRGIQVTAYV